MSVEKNPVRSAAAGDCGIRVEDVGAGMVAADMYACGIAQKKREMERLAPGTLAYKTKLTVIQEAERTRAGILAQIDRLGG